MLTKNMSLSVKNFVLDRQELIYPSYRRFIVNNLALCTNVSTIIALEFCCFCYGVWSYRMHDAALIIAKATGKMLSLTV